MADFTRRVYLKNERSFPPLTLLPIFNLRNSTPQELEGQDKALQVIASPQLQHKKPYEILFIDDEIGTGDTIKTALQTVMDVTRINRTRCYVLAEDDGFDSNLGKDGVSIVFKPFSKYINISNAIFWFIPYKYERPVKEAIKNIPGLVGDFDKWPMNILLNVPIKYRQNGLPIFGYEYHKKVKSLLPNLDELQKEFQDYVDQLILKAMQV